MAWDISADPVQPEAAIRWLRARLPLPEEEFRALSEEARRRAFFLSGVATLDLVQETLAALEKAISQGTTFAEFRRDLPEQLRRAWKGHRLRTIFDTNLQKAYGAGRYRQASETEDARPYWGLEVVLDGRTSPICSNLVGLVLPAEEMRRRRLIPPLHFRCRTALVTFTAEQARARGITRTPPEAQAQEGFGAPPEDDEWSPDPERYHPELWAAFQRSQAAASAPAREFVVSDAQLAPINRRYERDHEAMTDISLRVLRTHLPEREVQLAVERIEEWTATYSADPFQVELRESVERLLRGQAPRNSAEEILQRWMATRPNRVAEVYQAHGLPVPTAFRVLRGVHDLQQEDLRDFVRVWLDQSARDVQPLARSLSSWSTSPAKAQQLAVWSSTPNSPGAVFEAEVAVEMTLADKLTDDSGFVTPHFSEDEVIVISLPEAPLRVDKTRLRIWYDRRWWGYEDRLELAHHLGLR